VFTDIPQKTFFTSSDETSNFEVFIKTPVGVHNEIGKVEFWLMGERQACEKVFVFTALINPLS